MSCLSSQRLRTLISGLLPAVIGMSGTALFTTPALASEQMTRTEYCDLLRDKQLSAGADTERGQQLAETHQEVCTKDGRLLTQAEYQEAVDPALAASMTSVVDPNAATPVTIDNAKLIAETRVKEANADPNSLFDVCKSVGSTTVVSCQENAAMATAPSESRYKQLMQTMSGSTLEKSCNQISAYTGEAQSAASTIANTCQQLYEQCKQTCDTAVATYENMVRQRSANYVLTTWAQTNRTAGFNQCARIQAMISSAKNLPAANTASLTNACQSARKNQLAEKKVTKDESEENGGLNPNIMNAIGAAIPAVMGAIAPAQIPTPPRGVDQVQLFNQAAPLSAVAPSVTRGQSGYLPSGAKPTTALPGDLTMGGPADHEKKPRLAIPFGGGGGGGAPSASGGGAPPSAGDKNRRRGGSSFDTNVNSGYLGGGAGSPGRFKAYDDPDGSSRGRGGAPAVGVGVAGNLADAMNRFKPSWFARREVATVTGPDGITGPHTNIFRKVRDRYNKVILDERASFGK